MNRDYTSPSLVSPPRALRLGIFGLALAGVSLAQGQAIYAASEQAGPGAAISVRGDGLDANARFMVYPYSAAGVRGAGISVTPDTATGKIATMRLPRTLANSVYEIAASTVKGPTNSVFVNRARMQWTDVPDAMPGQIVRIVGRNFAPFANPNPTVTLTNAATKATLPATVVNATDSVLKVQVPANAPAGAYTINMNNGVAAAASADPNAQSLTVRAAANDPFALGVAWGADFATLASTVYNLRTDPRLPAHVAGDGATEDGLPLAVDLIYIQAHGGGVAYLPAGTYRVDDGSTRCFIYGKTVLRGAGKGQTILQVGYTYTPTHAPSDNHGPLALWSDNTAGTGVEGLADLTVQNLNTSATPNDVLTSGYGATRETFIKNVDFQMGNARNGYLNVPNKLMVSDCSFTSTSPLYCTFWFTNATEFQYLRNTEYHRASRLSITMAQRAVIEGNVVHFDNNYRNAGSAETGGLETSGGQQVLVLNNELGAIGAPPNRIATDGEVVLTQIAVTKEFMYTGMVKTAAQRVLVPTANFPTTTWQDPAQPTPTSRMCVLIVSGKGAGQWRHATSWTGASVTVDQAWQITPDATSRFAISPLDNFQQTFATNRLFGGFYGIEWENGAIDSNLEANTLTDTGYIGLLAYTNDCRNGQFGANGSTSSFTAAWGDQIIGNTLNNTTGARPATISVTAIDTLNLNLGPLMLGVDVRDNTVVGHFMQPIYSQYGRTDGLEVQSLDPGYPYTGNDVLNQGTVFQDNAISNSDYPVVVVNMTATVSGYLTNTPSAAPAAPAAVPSARGSLALLSRWLEA